jgi:hypothetical protein
MDLKAVVVGDHSGVELQERASLCHHGLGAVGDGLDEPEEAGLLGQESGRMVVDVDIFQQQRLFRH